MAKKKYKNKYSIYNHTWHSGINITARQEAKDHMLFSKHTSFKQMEA